ncbi:AAL112Cp [Eremothecium gossypii ATCC 10895]|uniref:Aprataxin-like protein n=1 Tax=Eremothecium gossypii (strain ATCC 10895 / CBS 109.51 / FGSC 9923 / NRRL Y-1056) TaxID=284811 RepID=Q75F40_EREGS|nr:AAL112Cp [Eremothecium gossypii ATCC 10895]AAS50254.1 AAL112Cp [Eremothecium gossypii ATCC 10895]AEY94539.1 FAAL112Cp [Eremothecium gossypii FDAG1]
MSEIYYVEEKTTSEPGVDENPILTHWLLKDDIRVCKHCRRTFEASRFSEYAAKQHLARYHTQVDETMSFTQYIQEFSPTYEWGVHKCRLHNERSFSIEFFKYIMAPSKWENELLYYDEHAVIIKDKFPKAQQHVLVIPRAIKTTLKHPTQLSITDKDKYQKHIDWALNYIWHDFTSKYKLKPGSSSPFSSHEEFNSLAHFIANFTQVGVHSVPSMENLHIHVMTTDFYSKSMKHKKHFNSFNTEFFVRWDRLPLAEVPNTDAMERRIRESELTCTYCKQGFSNRFAALSRHLGEEFHCRFVPVK